jgi:hypothetical protein
MQALAADTEARLDKLRVSQREEADLWGREQ